MIYRTLFEKTAGSHRPVRAGVIGTGHYATAILTQSRSIPGLDVPVVADIDVEAGLLALSRAGWTKEEIAVCDTASAARAALDQGKRVLLTDALAMMELLVEVVVEATGVAAAGALHGREALRRGKHVAMVTKETDCAVGPILKRQADQAGLVYTAVDGDQHGLLIGLVQWARTLGLEILCAGKALEFDVVFDPLKRTLQCDQETLPLDAAGAAAFAPRRGTAVREASEERRRRLGTLCRLMGYDVTEMTLAVNGTGLLPDIDRLHCPVVRIAEMADALTPSERGGLLGRAGVVDAVSCLRTPDEPGLAGGVFVVVGCASDYSREILRAKGHLCNERGDAFLLFRPHHLCGVETPLSILTAARLGVPTGATEFLPHYDVVAEAVEPLGAGQPLPTDKSTAVRALMRPARSIATPTHPAPLHVASGCRLKRDVPAGALVTMADIEPPANSPLWDLRREQDRQFLR